MNERATQVLLAALGVLLVAHFLRTMPLGSSAHGQEAAKVSAAIRARMIELVDERGQIRANLTVATDGEVVFRMMDAKGTIRVKLGASEDGSGLLLLDDQTEPGVHLLAQRSGTTVTLTEKGKEKLVITP